MIWKSVKIVCTFINTKCYYIIATPIGVFQANAQLRNFNRYLVACTLASQRYGPENYDIGVT